MLKKKKKAAFHSQKSLLLFLVHPNWPPAKLEESCVGGLNSTETHSIHIPQDTWIFLLSSSRTFYI